MTLLTYNKLACKRFVDQRSRTKGRERASGTMAAMPGFVPTPFGEQVEAAIDILGNRIRVAILGHLRKNGPAQRADIAEALSIVPSSVSNQLVVLMNAGVITADVPEGHVRPGTRVRYAVVPERVAAMYEDLGRALGYDDASAN